MAEFHKILDQISGTQKTLQDVGNQIVERYPQSKNLVDLASDLSVAVEGLESLKTRLSESLAEAEQDNALKEDIKLQIADKPMYQSLPDDEKRLLAEWLVQNKQGLASEEQLKEFVQEKFANKDDKQIMGEFNKPYIINLGKELMTDADEFEAYAAGIDHLKQGLATPEGKKEIIDRIADEYLKTMPHRLIHMYYEDAFV